MTATPLPQRAAFVYPIFFLSGIAGLGYEIVWAKMFATGLGHEMPSLLAVVAAFFGGLALGAWALDGLVSRSRTPGRIYAICEIVIGGWALVSVYAIPQLNGLAADWIGVTPSPFRHWLVAFAVPFFGLLPATAAMGATLPAMDRLVARLRGTGGVVSGLYSVNTAGAMAGTLLATFVLMPAAGHRTTLLVLAVLNAICAVTVALGPAAGEADRPEVEHVFEDPPASWRLGLTIFLTGLLGIGYEVLGVRVMSQVLENTVYSFASALSVFLLGTALGAAVYQRLASKRDFVGPVVWLLQGLALACLLGVFVLRISGSIYESVRETLGAGARASIAAEMMVALCVFFVPTLLMGATFSHLAQAARTTRGGVGRALGINTIGSSLAPLLFGVVLLPAIGSMWTLAIVAGGYLLLVPLALPPRALRPWRLVPAVVTAMLVFVLPANLVLIEAAPGSRIVEYREGVMAAVAVTEDPIGGRMLKVNDRFYMGGTGRSFADRRQAHIPLLLHPNPRSVLFLGLGTGITAGAAAHHPAMAVHAVELVPEVIDLLEAFAPANNLAMVDVEKNYAAADARRYVRATETRYDVIIADLFHPARDGAGALYTVEHFAAVRERLEPGGLFCQWLPLYQLEIDTVRLIVRTFLEVFPDSIGILAHFNVEHPMLGLVALPPDVAYRLDHYARRFPADSPVARELDKAALSNAFTLYGSLLAGTAGLRQFAGDGPLNTDDHPRVVYEAPAFTYRGGESGYERLVPVLEAFAPAADQILAPDDSDAGRDFARRLDAYLAARGIYLRAQLRRHVGAPDEANDMLLEAAARSADFRTATVVAQGEAERLIDEDPERARAILRRLVEIDPGNRRARQLLQQISRRR